MATDLNESHCKAWFTLDAVNPKATSTASTETTTMPAANAHRSTVRGARATAKTASTMAHTAPASRMVGVDITGPFLPNQSVQRNLHHF